MASNGWLIDRVHHFGPMEHDPAYPVFTGDVERFVAGEIHWARLQLVDYLVKSNGMIPACQPDTSSGLSPHGTSQDRHFLWLSLVGSQNTMCQSCGRHWGGPHIMTTETDSTVQRLRCLLDRQAILDCVHNYCRALDRLDRALLLSVYHPDAIEGMYDPAQSS
jgi:hypothetical protein